jgi:GT2 family glycosyltransferase
MNDITVFIFNYNGKDHVEKCMKAIQAQTMRHDTVFMDNGSEDGSELVAKNKGIRVVRNSRNMYIQYMQQQALDLCRTKYAAFCHIDCIPEKKWLEKMYNVAEKENAGAVEPEIIHPTGQVLHGELTDFFAPVLIDECQKYPMLVCTAATLYRNTRLKLFNPSYLHYHDDSHASEVLKRNGYGLIHLGDCKVKHYGSYSGLMGLKWKALARFNQMRMILKFWHPAVNPFADTNSWICHGGMVGEEQFAEVIKKGRLNEM